MLPDDSSLFYDSVLRRLNAPTGAWCSLTRPGRKCSRANKPSQCTYRCVVLPDQVTQEAAWAVYMSQCTYRCVVLPDETLEEESCSLSASQCTYRCVVLPDKARATLRSSRMRLNAPTGAWCSLTEESWLRRLPQWSQCTYRCVVLPDMSFVVVPIVTFAVSMHLQVRGAP